MYDTVIIGGGMSGFAAALHLVEKGYKTALISKGDPTCSLSTGCIDVLGKTARPIAGIDSLPENHPYRIAGIDAVRESIDWFKSMMSTTSLPYFGSHEENTEILTPIGTTKTTCLVPGTMKAARCTEDEYIHVISFEGIKDFYPSYITSRRPNSGYSIFDANVPSTIAIANRFEDEEFLASFISWLKSIEMPAGKIALPAVLGMNSSMEIMNRISKELEREIFEIPTIPPSIPGLRLFRTLKKAFIQRGGDIYWGKEVASFEKSKALVEAVTLQTPGRPTRVQGKTFILATGSFVSGGLYAHRDSVEESVFGLDVNLPGGRENWFNSEFFTPGHQIEKTGILTDESLRPKNSDLSNLFVCGSIMAFSEIMKNQCGHGLALATGLTAAKNCERQLS